MSKDIDEASGRSHHIVTKIYDNDGDLIKMISGTVQGDYELTEQDKKYLEWLDDRREKRTIIEIEGH